MCAAYRSRTIGGGVRNGRFHATPANRDQRRCGRRWIEYSAAGQGSFRGAIGYRRGNGAVIQIEWHHDAGIPMTDVMTVQTIKDSKTRTIQMQAFERTVLTYDPLNRADWQIERGNIGVDVAALPDSST